ncbi:hypothetical protein BGZ94_007764 [Podila epigama]|nr:hypothetical protein BGZ94_007764 [Podila epigama]
MSIRQPVQFDVVYTWVNGSEADFDVCRVHYQLQNPLVRSYMEDHKALSKRNFQDLDMLRYSVRSLSRYARMHAIEMQSTDNGITTMNTVVKPPLLRKIFIVSADAPNKTLANELHKKIQETKRQIHEQWAMDQLQEIRRIQGAQVAVKDTLSTESIQEQPVKKLIQEEPIKEEPVHKPNQEESIQKEPIQEEPFPSVEDKVQFVESGPLINIAEAPTPVWQQPPEDIEHLEDTNSSFVERGQVPYWLDRSPSVRKKIDTVHHRDIFPDPSPLPVYHSSPITANLHRVAGLQELFLYMTDEMFLGDNVSAADFYTPLYGFVFRFRFDSLVPPSVRIKPKTSNRLHTTNMDYLQYTNSLLSQKFGPRFRPALSGQIQVVSRSIIQEIEQLWPDAFLQASRTRFAFQEDAANLVPSFMAAHFVIERLRETQLRSFWKHRLDQNGNGKLEPEERHQLCELLRKWITSNETDQAGRPLLPKHLTTGLAPISHLQDYKTVLFDARYNDRPDLKTTYLLSSFDSVPFLLNNANLSREIPVHVPTDNDGYLAQDRSPQKPYTVETPPNRRTCAMDLQFCFGEQFLNESTVLDEAASSAIFQRIAFDQFHCGDCLLHIVMMSNSGVDFEEEQAPEQYHRTLLFRRQRPPPRVHRQSRSEWRPSQHRLGLNAILPLRNRTSENEYQRIVNDLYRYNYVFGTSSETTANIAHREDISSVGSRLQLGSRNTFLRIKDRLDGTDTPQLLSAFLQQRFFEPSPWEVTPHDEGAKGR